MKNKRKVPFCWQDKTYLRKFRKDFTGAALSKIRNLYLTLTEIESDFNDKPIKYYTKTIAAYSGLSKDWIPKGLKILENYGLISIIEERENGKYKGKMIVFNELSPPKTVTGKTVNGKSFNGKTDPSDDSILLDEPFLQDENNTPPASSGTIVPSEASPPNEGGNPSSLDRQRSSNKEGESVEQGESLPNKGKTRKGLPLKNVCRDENLSPVWLTEKEYNKLRNLFGRRMLEDSIESLAAYITSRGKRYKNHYAALRNWLKRETEKQPLSPEDEFIANLPPAGNYDL